MNNKLITLSILLLFLSACNPNLTWEEENEQHCKFEMTFPCDYDPNDIASFKGKLNGKEFCISTPYNNNRLYNVIGTKTTTSTSDPSISPDTQPFGSFYNIGISKPIFNGDQFMDFAPSIHFQTPTILDTIIYLPEKYINDFIKEGDLVLRDWGVDETDGFNFYIDWQCKMEPYNGPENKQPNVYYRLSPLEGKQENMIFKVTEFEKIDGPWMIEYHITFEIECDLYYFNENEYFGRLEDGVFKTFIGIPK